MPELNEYLEVLLQFDLHLVPVVKYRTLKIPLRARRIIFPLRVDIWTTEPTLRCAYEEPCTSMLTMSICSGTQRSHWERKDGLNDTEPPPAPPG